MKINPINPHDIFIWHAISIGFRKTVSWSDSSEAGHWLLPYITVQYPILINGILQSCQGINSTTYIKVTWKIFIFKVCSTYKELSNELLQKSVCESNFVSPMANKAKIFNCHSANQKIVQRKYFFADFLFIPSGMIIQIISEFFRKTCFWQPLVDMPTEGWVH